MEKFTSLMKDILNNKKVGKLTFNADDNLSKRLNKLMNWLYKNYDKNEDDIVNALKEEFDSVVKIESNDDDEKFTKLSLSALNSLGHYADIYRVDDKKFVMLDKENKFKKAEDGSRYYFRDEHDLKYTCFNEKSILGLYLVYNDILNEKNINLLKENNLNVDDLKYCIRLFKNNRNSNIMNYSRFGKYEICLRIINEYVNNNYQYKLQYDYEKNIDKVTRATAWITKKTINEQTKKAMENTRLNEMYKFVELDNDVDLEKLTMFESEMERVKNNLPRFESEKQAILRLRKLGNYKALGMYVPANNTIAIDFRDGKDTDVMNYNEAGVQSFVHEYGHFLDYRSNNGRLSGKDEFVELMTNYSNNLNDFAKKNKNDFVSKELDYYLTPTEIFARGFELFMRKVGLKTSLMHDDEVYNNRPEYTAFDENLVMEYYSNVFTEFKVS